MPFALSVKSTIEFFLGWCRVKAVDKQAFNESLSSGWGAFLLTRIIIPLNWISMMISMILMPAYVIGRVGLLVQASIALRDLQQLERAEVRWVTLLPHL